MTGTAGTQDRRRLVAVVRGLVQGVGYRWFVQREASRLGLVGWVANQMDASVEVVAEGPDGDLERLVLALWEGPAAAMVSDVAVRHEPARGGIGSFTVRSGAHPGD
jgi:acylphosphatase